MLERRRLTRTQVFKLAALCPHDAEQPTKCTVRDITSLGACIEIADATAVADRFTLSLDRFRSERVCQVIWRRENRIGVAFCAEEPATRARA